MEEYRVHSIEFMDLDYPDGVKVNLPPNSVVQVDKVQLWSVEKGKITVYAGEFPTLRYISTSENEVLWWLVPPE